MSCLVHECTRLLWHAPSRGNRNKSLGPIKVCSERGERDDMIHTTASISISQPAVQTTICSRLGTLSRAQHPSDSHLPRMLPTHWASPAVTQIPSMPILEQIYDTGPNETNTAPQVLWRQQKPCFRADFYTASRVPSQNNWHDMDSKPIIEVSLLLTPSFFPICCT